MKPTVPSGRKLLMSGALALLMSASPANADIIEFRPQSLVAGLGETIALDIFATDLDGEIVSAYDLDITYDSLILSAVGVTFGSSLGDPLFFDVLEAFEVSVPGLIDLAQLSLLPDDLLFAMQGGGDVFLATVVFETLAAGVSSLDFVFDAFNDVKGFDAAVLPVTGIAGQVVVESPVAVPEPPPAALLLTGLVLLILQRRRCRVQGDQR